MITMIIVFFGLAAIGIFLLFYGGLQEEYGLCILGIFMFIIFGVLTCTNLEIEVDNNYIFSNKGKTFTLIKDRSENPFKKEDQEKIFIKIIEVKDYYVKYAITENGETEEFTGKTSYFSTNFIEKTEEYLNK
jgi:hypothetical protein